MSSETISSNIENDKRSEIQKGNSVKYIKFWSCMFGLLALVFGVGKLCALMGIWSIPDSAGVGFIKTNGPYSWLMFIIMPGLISLGLWFTKRWVALVLGLYCVIMVPGMLYHWNDGSNLGSAIVLFGAALNLYRSWQYFD